MITLEQAIDIAVNRNEKYNAVQEYADAYEFFIDDGEIRYGGGDNGVIIEKSTGNVLRWAEYFMRKKNVIEIGEPKKIKDIKHE